MLLERRPDIAAAERRAAAANAQIGVAESAFFPSLTLSATGGFQSSVLSHLLSLPSRFWSLGPALAQTVFDAGLRRAQTAQAMATYDENVATYRQTVLGGFQEVEDNLAALRILGQEAAVQAEAVQAARESLAIVTNQYRAGTVNYLAVVVVQATALANERTALNILGRRLTASAAVPRRSAVSHCMSTEARFHSTNVSYIYNRYKRVGDETMDESFLPILWRRDGYLSPICQDFRDAVVQWCQEEGA